MSKTMEKFKMRMWQLKNEQMKKEETKSWPFLCNFSEKLEKELNSLDTVKVVVEPVVKSDIPKKLTEIVELRSLYKHRMITSIRCPLCGQILNLDDRWKAFICKNGHPLVRWEVVGIKYGDEIYTKVG